MNQRLLAAAISFAACLIASTPAQSATPPQASTPVVAPSAPPAPRGVPSSTPAPTASQAPLGGRDFGQHVSGMAPEHPLEHGGRMFGECVSEMAITGQMCEHMAP